MAKLAEDIDVYNYLQIDPSDDLAGVALTIRDSIEDTIEQETNNVFGPSETLVQDPYDGQGSNIIFVRRPMLSLEKIEFRYLPEVVQELYFNLDITQYITWSIGKRRIYSHVYPFVRGYDNILISYTTQANQPALAKGAVLEAVAAVYRTIGSEDARNEQKGTFQHTLIRSLDECRMWPLAVAKFTVPTLG